ncbi:hypothetical protein MOQ_004137 [Trypanosoma cruzi marinkellei]|uniref:Uncharacterized protein n=1 Tax=Trypanosoma cruzi marinkellei TaxID=85056 RepID=K2NAX1_TRYCR|nr:hypothetical protein MOQ_004137 [Trypanosoma cruzi marinkellei]
MSLKTFYFYFYCFQFKVEFLHSLFFCCFYCLRIEFVFWWVIVVFLSLCIILFFSLSILEYPSCFFPFCRCSCADPCVSVRALFSRLFPFFFLSLSLCVCVCVSSLRASLCIQRGFLPVHTIKMEPSAMEASNELSMADEARLMSALFPYVSSKCLWECVKATKSVEETIFHVNATVNPDLYSASYLINAMRNSTSSTEVATKGTQRNADSCVMAVDSDGNEIVDSSEDQFVSVGSFLHSRSSLFDGEMNILEVDQQQEYNATVAVFPIDTAKWDEHFITSATLTDVVGAQPLALPTPVEKTPSQKDVGGSGDAIQAPIVRWAPTAASLKKKLDESKRISSCEAPSPSTCILNCEEERGESNARDASGLGTKKKKKMADGAMHTVGNVDPVLLTPLQFCTQHECELRERLEEVERDGATAFVNMEETDFCKGIVEHCKTFTSALPEYFPKLLSVVAKEFEGKEVVPALHNIRLKTFSGGLLNTEEARIRKIVLGRSYARFSEDGEHILFRVKLKHLSLSPVSFSLAREEGRGDATKGTLKAKAKNIKLKAKLELKLHLTGRLIARCGNIHFFIGSLQTKCSVFGLNAVAFFCRPFLKQKLISFVVKALSEEMFLDLA